jgi:hypothetical protein
MVTLSRICGWLGASLLAGGMLFSGSIGHGQTRTPAPVQAHITDVQIRQDGSLLGMVLDRQGNPMPQTRLWISGNDQVLETITDHQGRFAIRDLRGGVYKVSTGAEQQVIRAWVADTAPPNALGGVTLIQGDVVRGQPPYNPNVGPYDGAIWRTLTNPWVISAGVAAAIAIPLALDEDDAS